MNVGKSYVHVSDGWVILKMYMNIFLIHYLVLFYSGSLLSTFWFLFLSYSDTKLLLLSSESAQWRFPLKCWQSGPRGKRINKNNKRTEMCLNTSLISQPYVWVKGDNSASQLNCTVAKHQLRMCNSRVHLFLWSWQRIFHVLVQYLSAAFCWNLSKLSDKTYGNSTKSWFKKNHSIF